jgi:hypothetical protein
MTPQEQQDKIARAVALLTEVATDRLRECEACQLPCSDVRIELVGECPDHGTVPVWMSGNAVNAGDAIQSLTGHRLDPSLYPTFGG